MKYTLLPLAAMMTASLYGCGGSPGESSSTPAISSTAPISSAPIASSSSSKTSSSLAPSSSTAPASSTPASSSSVASSVSAGTALTIEENTTGYCGTSGMGIVDTKHAGYNGAGFVDAENVKGSTITWQINASESAEYTVTVRYALLDGANRSGILVANGNNGVMANFNLASTGAWTSWKTEINRIALNQGSNRLVLTADTELGLANIDSITISGPQVTAETCAAMASSSSPSTSSAGSTSSTGTTPTGKYVYPGPIENGNKGTQSTTAGGFATTKGGGLPIYDGAGKVTGSTLAGARVKYATSFAQMNEIVAAARIDDAGKKVTAGAYPLLIVYSGNEDSLINTIVKDHTANANGDCPKGHWNDTFREVALKEYTAGLTIIGTNGSSANFGITIVKAGNVIIRNMTIGALGGASSDADMIRIDDSSNVWIDHNDLFAVNNKCNGAPGDGGDLTFESSIDIKKNSHNITVSYNVIRDSQKIGLDGSSSSDIAGGREITFHHNVYRNVNARLPLQRGGWTHMYNNLYDGITGSGINVRQAGYSLIESNWFQNAANPVTCRYDSSNCGWWDLRNNNIQSPSDFATYNITWTSGGTVDATDWTTTKKFPITLPYSYTPATPACVRARLESVAGVGKNFAALSCN
ncbi:MAG: carbohydrate-binding protein [Marinagarivorans sp.]|nr:carbohydrate-binding protein [Marinagarivorans sp.]